MPLLKIVRTTLLALVAASVALAATVSAQSGRKGTRTSISVSPSASKVGQSLTLTAVVTTQTAADKPQGALHFFADDALLEIVPLATDGDRSTASMEVATLAVGVHRISARYAGHPQFLPSASVSVAHVVTQQ
jgi:hypothetical protein